MFRNEFDPGWDGKFDVGEFKAWYATILITRMNPRGRGRRSRNLRRVPTTEEAGVGEGSKISPLRRLYSSWTPLLEEFFLENAFKIVSK